MESTTLQDAFAEQEEQESLIALDEDSRKSDGLNATAEHTGQQQPQHQDDIMTSESKTTVDEMETTKKARDTNTDKPFTLASIATDIVESLPFDGPASQAPIMPRGVLVVINVAAVALMLLLGVLTVCLRDQPDVQIHTGALFLIAAALFATVQWYVCVERCAIVAYFANYRVASLVDLFFVLH